MDDADPLERTPLLTEEGAQLLRQLREHPDAPRWNYAVGDRLIANDLPAIDHFRDQLATMRGRRLDGPPPPPVLNFLASLRALVPCFRRQIPPTIDLERDWSSIPTTSRRDLAAAPWEFVPDDIDLGRLVIYRTAGTTGHPIQVPHHPRAIGCYEALIERALLAHGVKLDLDARRAICFLVSAQVKTYTYSTVLSAWAGAGFAKLNLRPAEWPHEESAGRYFRAFAPPLVTGEPVSFAELLRMDIPVRPTALVSTSVALSPSLAARLRERFGCPVIDWYSLVETGPLAYSCPLGTGLHVLPHDVHVEVVRPDGAPAPPGERGEIVVTGGRNPYLPLLRYRTGDWARLDVQPCACGDSMPRLVDLEGRTPILFRSSDGTPVGTVDLSRLLREFPLLQHAFTQHRDKSCELVVRPLPDQPAPGPQEIENALRALLGSLPIEVRVDPHLGDDDAKVIPYTSAITLGD
jgi:phenylacetate-CoA ligase